MTTTAPAPVPIPSPSPSVVTPFDVLKQQYRMQTHLRHHRDHLCGVEMLSDACARYISELYPAGDAHATDSTRTAVALFAFLTNQVNRLRDRALAVPLRGAPCPFSESTHSPESTQSQSHPKPQVLYVNLTESTHNCFDTTQGLALVIVCSKQRVRILHAIDGVCTLEEHMRSTGSMTQAAFETWWRTLQTALSPSTPATLFEKLFCKSPKQIHSVTGSWIHLADIDLGFHQPYYPFPKECVALDKAIQHSGELVNRALLKVQQTTPPTALTAPAAPAASPPWTKKALAEDAQRRRPKYVRSGNSRQAASEARIFFQDHAPQLQPTIARGILYVPNDTLQVKNLWDTVKYGYGNAEDTQYVLSPHGVGLWEKATPEQKLQLSPTANALGVEHYVTLVTLSPSPSSSLAPTSTSAPSSERVAVDWGAGQFVTVPSNARLFIQDSDSLI